MVNLCISSLIISTVADGPFQPLDIWNVRFTKEGRQVIDVIRTGHTVHTYPPTREMII